ncbi:MAG: PH domain-containing protein [Candidatus Heimdallarchaeota archaeon]
MSNKSPSRFSLKASAEYIIQWMVFTLILNLGLYLMMRYLVHPRILGLNLTPERIDLYSKLSWAGSLLVNFILFTVVYLIISAPRYWIDDNGIEIKSIYRAKKKLTFDYVEITEIKIRQTPIISSAFNFGTIVFYKTDQNEKKRVAFRFFGVKYPKEVYLEIIANFENVKQEEITAEDLLL